MFHHVSEENIAFLSIAQPIEIKSVVHLPATCNNSECDIGTTKSKQKRREQKRSREKKNKNNARAKLETRKRGEGVAWERGRI